MEELVKYGCGEDGDMPEAINVIGPGHGRRSPRIGKEVQDVAVRETSALFFAPTALGSKFEDTFTPVNMSAS